MGNTLVSNHKSGSAFSREIGRPPNKVGGPKKTKGVRSRELRKGVVQMNSWEPAIEPTEKILIKLG